MGPHIVWISSHAWLQGAGTLEIHSFTGWVREIWRLSDQPLTRGANKPIEANGMTAFHWLQRSSAQKFDHRPGSSLFIARFSQRTRTCCCWAAQQLPGQPVDSYWPSNIQWLDCCYRTIDDDHESSWITMSFFKRLIGMMIFHHYFIIIDGFCWLIVIIKHHWPELPSLAIENHQSPSIVNMPILIVVVGHFCLFLSSIICFRSPFLVVIHNSSSLELLVICQYLFAGTSHPWQRSVITGPYLPRSATTCHY